MIKIGSVLLGICLTLTSAAGHAKGASESCDPRQLKTLDIPFPWGAEIDFDWDEIVGTWKTNSRETPSYFSFRVIQSKRTNKKQLVVIEYDPRNCRYISTGYGAEDDRVIRTIMSSQGSRYSLELRTFKTADIAKLHCPTVTFKDNRPMMVISMSSMFDGADTKSMVLSKISSKSKPPCSK